MTSAGIITAAISTAYCSFAYLLHGSLLNVYHHHQQQQLRLVEWCVQKETSLHLNKLTKNNRDKLLSSSKNVLKRNIIFESWVNLEIVNLAISVQLSVILMQPKSSPLKILAGWSAIIRLFSSISQHLQTAYYKTISVNVCSILGNTQMTKQLMRVGISITKGSHKLTQVNNWWLNLHKL